MNKTEGLVDLDFPAEKILVINADGDNLGEMSVAAGLVKAEQAGLDLVCVAPQAKVPVCRMMNYSKYRYEQKKRKREAQKNQRKVTVKEVRLSPVIGENDFQTKLKNGRRFLMQGDKIKVSLTFRRRARMLFGTDNPDISMLTKFIEATADIASVEQEPKQEGRNINMVLGPKK